MRHGLGLLLAGVALLAGSGTALAGRHHSGQYWADRAVERAGAQPACRAISTPTPTSDAPVPAEVLERYALLRLPATEPVVPPVVYGAGALPRDGARTRTLDGVVITVTALLDWRPEVPTTACEAVERRALETLLRNVRARTVRARARAIIAGRHRALDRVRRQRARTLLLVSAPSVSPVAVTGTPAYSRWRGLYFSGPGATDRDRTFVGLIPDGVARIRYRAKGEQDVEAPVVDNLVVVRMTWQHRQGPRLSQQVWLRADGSVVRTIGKLR